MPDPSLSDAIKEAYAVAPADEVILHTLELRHPAFVEGGEPTAIRVVRDHNQLIARLEAGAPLNAGELATFVPMGFEFRLPPIEQSATPEIEIAIDNVGRELMTWLDLAIVDPTPIRVTYRPYLLSDVDTPQMIPPPTFTLAEVSADPMRVTAKARFGLDLNKAFPALVYTAQAFPGLVGR